jgi:hypothetical protein
VRSLYISYRCQTLKSEPRALAGLFGSLGKWRARLVGLLARRTPAQSLVPSILQSQSNRTSQPFQLLLEVRLNRILTRSYPQDLHRTGTTVEQEWPDFYNWARQHGSHYADVAGLQGEPRFSDNETQLREAEKREADRMLEDRDSGLGSNLSHRERRDTESHGPRPMTPTSPGYAHSTSIDNRMGQATGSPFSAYQQDQARNRGGEEGSGQGGARRVSAGPTVIRKNQVVTQMVLFTSAERIFARYLMENAEKPVYFP